MTQQITQTMPVSPGQSHHSPQAQSLDLILLKDVWDAIWRSKWGIGSITLIAIVVALLVAFTLPPVYRATATVLIKSDIGSPIARMPDVYNPGTDQPAYYYTQLQIIQSRSVIKQVVDKLNLVDNPEFASAIKPGFFDNLDIAKWLPFLPRQIPTEKTQAQIKRDQTERVINAFRDQHLNVELVLGSKIVKVSVDAEDPELAAKMANALVNAYINTGLDARLDMAKQVTGWLNDRLGGVKENLAEAEAKLQQFREQQGLVSVGNAGGLLKSTLASNIEQLRQAKLKMTELDSAYHKIRQAGSDPAKLESVSTLLADPVVRGAKTNMLQAAQAVDTLASRYGPKHPKMIQAQATLKAATEAYHKQLLTAAAGVKAQYQVAAQTAKALESVAQDARAQMQGLGRQSYQLSVLQRNVQANKQLYDTFLQRFKETNVLGDYQAVQARQIDQATVPDDAYKPRKKFIVVVATALGLLLGLALALLRYFLVDVVRSSDSLEQATGLGTLGSLQLMSSIKTGKPEYLQPKLSRFIEGIRSLRTGLILADTVGRKKVVMVTSAVPEEGKTTIAVNLAIAMGKNEKVLLVDCDLRRPSLVRRLNLKGKKYGLMELLTGEQDEAQCIHHLEEAGIDVLPVMRAPPNAAEVAGSAALHAVLKNLGQKYDRIIIDTAPCQAVSDSLLVSRVCNGVLLVVKSESTSKRVIQRTMRQLHAAQAVVIGAVINQVDAKNHAYYYGGGYYDYGVTPG